MAIETPQVIGRQASSGKRLPRLAQAVEAINQSSGRALFGIVVFYAVLVLPLAMLKLLWADEFITYYIAKLDSLHAIWNALARGVDPNPPAMHVLVMWSMRLFGDSELAVRLPAILACLLGVVCLFLFLRRRVPVVYAAAGACFFMATAAINYAYESRSYALILAFSMLSMLMWQESIEGRHQRLASVMLAIALAAGISSNYFAVLSFFPIAAGELARDLKRRKIEWRVWIALAVGGLPFLFFLPLINHAIVQFAPHAWNKATADVIPDSYTEMVEVILGPALVIFALGAGHYFYERKKQSVKPAILPRHEFVAVFLMLLYPMLGYVLAVARAGMMSPRFVLPVCWGFAIASVVICYRVFAKNAVAAGLLLVLFFSWALARDGFCAYDYVMQRYAFDRVLQSIPPANTLVVADSLLVQPLYHYSSPEVAVRMVFPIDFRLIDRYKREDSLEQNFWAGRKVFPVPIVSFQDLKQQYPGYVIVAADHNWLLQKFEVDGEPAKELDVQTHSRDIGGFTPLSHGATYFFEVGNALPWDMQYATTQQNSSMANFSRAPRGRVGGRGMQQ
ncbi:MAG TPA: glycosyltransferase family 39 protein [Terriglobales bacterium]|nr:glycosyltransferase family 39 protein [Terriglobales bacterium]